MASELFLPEDALDHSDSLRRELDSYAKASS